MSIRRMNFGGRGKDTPAGGPPGNVPMNVHRREVKKPGQPPKRYTDIAMCWRGRWFCSRHPGHLHDEVIERIQKPAFIARREAEEKANG